jgi:nicotinamide-nucleotide amidase
MNELTKSQAMVPDNATVIRNPIGTAPITWFEKEGKVIVSMPGVPYEMKQAMSAEIIPRLQQVFKVPAIIHKTILVHGYPESALAIKIADWENTLPGDISLAYLPNFNIVKLRLSAKTVDVTSTQTLFSDKVNQLKEILGDAILGEEDIPLEELVGRMLISSGKKIVTAESCTGGHIAHRLTSVSGSSAYFKGSVVAYSNELKENLLGVKTVDLIQHGAVSREVVEQMTTGALQLMGADIAISTSGIAGPDGGTAEKPVGTVWIAISTKKETVSRMFQFNLNRQLNIERTTQTALLM